MDTNPKGLQTRMGTLELEVPQVRGLGFYPRSLEKDTRSEKALKLAIAQMYLEGVSTRRIQDITKELCGYEISSTQVWNVTKELDEQFNEFRNRRLGEVLYLIVEDNCDSLLNVRSVLQRSWHLISSKNCPMLSECIPASPFLGCVEKSLREA